MSSGSFPTLSASLLVYVKLMKAVDEFMDSDTARKHASVYAGLEACKKKLEKYYDKSTSESEYYYAAAVLDPRIKHNLFDANPDFFTMMWRQHMDNNFKVRLEQYTTSLPSASSTSPTPSHSTSTSLNDLYNDFSLLGHPPSTYDAVESVSEEYARYLSFRPQLGEDSLTFHRKNCTSFPRIAAYARDILAIPGMYQP
ncbi:hypothetical protein E1B28_011390 [Marasmius oreades]|uniref:Transposase n=1 Tax=Marasmius oreades TaxID=181124 RepID=A0A9P7RV20_9AGAR|nr:uncharacterized protein E1B28_011390 [Marasmius oreades]KAG7089736.1 hypothetical protein E1B28_011390 [Marasmius oreades]